MALHASRLSGHIWSPRSARPSPQGREDFSSTTQKEMCTPPQIRHAAPAGKVVQGQTSDAMVSADMTLDIETSWAAQMKPRSLSPDIATGARIVGHLHSVRADRSSLRSDSPTVRK